MLRRSSAVNGVFFGIVSAKGFRDPRSFCELPIEAFFRVFMEASGVGSFCVFGEAPATVFFCVFGEAPVDAFFRDFGAGFAGFVLDLAMYVLR
jgi:hypothetical protein